LLDTFTWMGLASRLPGDAGTVSKVLELIRYLPSTAPSLGSIPSADHLSVLLNTAFWASLQQEEGRPIGVPLLLQSPSSAEDLVFKHSIPLTSRPSSSSPPPSTESDAVSASVRRGLRHSRSGVSRP
jgi:hypothetical protein